MIQLSNLVLATKLTFSRNPSGLYIVIYNRVGYKNKGLEISFTFPNSFYSRKSGNVQNIEELARSILLTEILDNLRQREKGKKVERPNYYVLYEELGNFFFPRGIPIPISLNKNGIKEMKSIRKITKTEFKEYKKELFNFLNNKDFYNEVLEEHLNWRKNNPEQSKLAERMAENFARELTDKENKNNIDYNYINHIGLN